MRTNKRKTPRRAIRYTAWVVPGHGMQRMRCTVYDVSVGGARLELQSADALPDAFMLMLTGSGETSRWCRVVWRSDNQIGVQFETMSAQEANAVLSHDQPTDMAATASS